jgi:phage terminase large subunit-like protein
MSEFDDPRALMALAEQWSPQAREDAARMVRDILEGKLRSWYCKSPGRHCDGQPHPGYDYPHARADQWPPLGTDWFAWFLSGGRGSGKTRTGAEYTRRMSEHVGRIALVAPTGPDARETMIEGESGLQYACALAGIKTKYEPSRRRFTFENGCIATTFSAEEPKRLRGPQHGFAWLDEPAAYDDPESVYDNLLFGLRLGRRPHVVLTSTPVPSPWVKKTQADPKTKVIRVSTYANIDNLAPQYREIVLSRYEGTRLGRQEIHGMLLEDVVGALWAEAMLQHIDFIDPGTMDRTVIGIDPAGGKGVKNDMTGIVAMGRKDQNAYVFADHTGHHSPTEWATIALQTAETLGADAIVAEKNFGGDMVKEVIDRVAKERGGLTPRVLVTTASRSKQVRAEPVVALYEQRRIFHVSDRRVMLPAGQFHPLEELEDEQLSWIPGTGPSPNRIDSLVWAGTELFKLSGDAGLGVPGAGRRAPSRGSGRTLGPRNVAQWAVR